MAKKRQALGRGLGALLSEADSPAAKREIEQEIIKVANFQEIPVENIETNPYQPRTHFDEEALNDLANSISVQGIIQPITVRKLNDKQYQLISGERRFQASKRAGLEKIPAYIRTANDQEMLEMAIIENVQRENLNSIEIALSYQRLLTECDLKQEELGDRVGKNRTTVNNYLRLLKLPPDIQAAVRDNKLSMGHARAIINIEDVDLQLEIFRKIIKDDLSVRKVEALVRSASEVSKKKETKTAPKDNKLNPELVKLQERLSSHFGTKVSIRNESENKGEIKIPYISVEDLNRILDILDM